MQVVRGEVDVVPDLVQTQNFVLEQPRHTPGTRPTRAEPRHRAVSGQYFPALQVGEQEQTDDRRQSPTGVEDNN
jgi:hypothetical protein